MAVLVEARQSHCSAEILQHPHSLLFSNCWDYGTHWTRASGHGWWMAGSKGSAGLPRQLRHGRGGSSRPCRGKCWLSEAARQDLAMHSPRKWRQAVCPALWMQKFWTREQRNCLQTFDSSPEFRKLEFRYIHCEGIQGVTQFSYQVFLLLKTAQNHSCLGLSCLFFWTRFFQKAIGLTPQGNLYPSA